MRLIVLLLVLLAIAGHWSAFAKPAAAADPVPIENIDWVRTTRGWEKLDTSRSEPTTREIIHPGIIAGGQLLASLLALVAWSGGKP